MELLGKIKSLLSPAKKKPEATEATEEAGEVFSAPRTPSGSPTGATEFDEQDTTHRDKTSSLAVARKEKESEHDKTERLFAQHREAAFSPSVSPARSRTASVASEARHLLDETIGTDASFATYRTESPEREVVDLTSRPVSPETVFSEEAREMFPDLGRERSGRAHVALTGEQQALREAEMRTEMGRLRGEFTAEERRQLRAGLAHAPEIAAFMARVPAHLPPIPVGVGAPRARPVTFRPRPAAINDQGNGAMFHTRFLAKGGLGPRGKIALPGGYIRIRPAEVTLVFTKVSRGTRQELTLFLSGRFPLGARIGKQTYTSALLIKEVLTRLPGTVTISY